MATQEDHAMENKTRRAVGTKFSPTSILLRSHSMSHHGLTVGGHGTEVIIFELVKNRNVVSYDITRPPTASAGTTNRVIGYTEKSDEEIERHGKRRNHLISHAAEVYTVIELMKMYATHYNVVTCNCQHFARDLALLIIDPTIVEPEFGSRYRFTRHHLKVATTFLYSGPAPGWIIPTDKTILVNVTQEADDPDTWEGEVEGTGKRGKFLRTYCCRCSQRLFQLIFLISVVLRLYSGTRVIKMWPYSSYIFYTS
jgi:hypothetical protein